MIDKIKELVKIESVTGAPAEGALPYGRAVDEALEYVLNLCRSFGFRTKNCSHRIGYAEIGEGKELIAVLCHLDVVPAGAGWTRNPFSCEEEDGKLYGRGVIDDKGPAVCAIYAMKELLDSGLPLNRRIRIIFGLQEESGSWEDMAWYKEHEELPHMGFTPDSKFPSIYCERGIAQFRLEMDLEKSGFISAEGGNAVNMVPDSASCRILSPEGEVLYFDAGGKSAHGSRPEEGDNAVSHLMDQVFRSGCSSAFAQWYMEQIGFTIHGEHIGLNLTDESGRLTLNPGKLFTENGKIVLLLDVRFPVTFTAGEVELRLAAATVSHNLSVQLISQEKPVYLKKDSEIMTALMTAYREITGDFCEPEIIGGGTYARAMDGIVAFGPAFPGKERTEHMADEYAFVEDLYKAKDIYYLAFKKLAAEKI